MSPGWLITPVQKRSVVTPFYFCGHPSWVGNRYDTLDEICGSFLTYEQKVNQFDEENKKEIVEKKKCLALKISSREEETYETACEDEDAKMAMLARRYNKLALQRDQRMGRKNFRRDRFRNDLSREKGHSGYMVR